MEPVETSLRDTHLAGDRPVEERRVRVKLVGVGGAGTNAVDRLRAEGLASVDLAALNTDSQALAASVLAEKVLIGWAVTRGLGAGGDPELGRLAAEADRERLTRVVAGQDLVVLVAGMGGGTGSGAAPVVAELAVQAGALVIAFVTMPFAFEGERRLKQADEALAELRKHCDAVIPLRNDLLLQDEDDDPVLQAFAKGDAWIARGVRAVADLLHRTGLINLDFASLRQVFIHKGGKTLFGFGSGRGPDPVTAAITELKMCPLRHTPDFARKADRLLINLTGGPDLTLVQVTEVMAAVAEEFGREAHVAFGAVIDETMAGQLEICVLGVSDPNQRARAARGATRAPFAGRRPSTPETRPIETAPASPAPAEPTAGMPGAVPAAEAAASPEPAAAQDEFRFGDLEARGSFEKTHGNFVDGQDLDVPTYLRRGIRIQP